MELISSLKSELIKAQKKGEGEGEGLINRLQQAIDAQEKNLKKRKKALNNPDTRVKSHAVKLAGNLSNAQAALMKRLVENHYSTEQIKSIADNVYRMNSYSLALGIETGRVKPDVAVEFLNKPDILDDLKKLARMGRMAQEGNRPADIAEQRERVAGLVASQYVPMTGDPRLGLDESFLFGEPAAPNVSKDMQMQGRESIPDNGITASLGGLLKTTTFAGWRPFQKAVHDAYNSMSKEQRTAAGFGRTKVKEREGSATGGIVYRTAGGNTYVYNFRNRDLLTALKKANMDDSSHFLDTLATPTRWFAYSATQLAPWFGPKNWIRDLWERTETVRRYENLVDEDGNPVDQNKVARRIWKYGKNSDVMRASGRYAAGKESDGGRIDEAIRTLAEEGAVFSSGDLFTKNRSRIINNIVKNGKGPQKLRRKLATMVDIYNRTFDMTPLVATYLSLRDAGVSEKRAAAVALDTMNFRKTGTAMPAIRAVYAFAQPAVTGASNMMSLLYDRRTGKVRPQGWRRLAGYTVAFLMLQSFARMLMDDEDDKTGSRGEISGYDRYNSIPIPFGDGILTLPLTFGLPRLANAMAVNLMGVGTGEADVRQGISDFLNLGLVPNISPLQPTNIDWGKNPFDAMVAFFSPSIVKPLAQVAINRNYFGSEIVKLSWEDKEKFRTEQFGYNTPEFYRDGARALRRVAGVDLAPEQMKHIIQGYTLGGARLALQMFERANDKTPEGDESHPLISAFYELPEHQAWKGQFYDMIDKTDVLIKRANAEEMGDATREELALLNLRQQWEAYKSQLRSRRARIQHMKITDKAKNRMLKNVSRVSDQIQLQFVIRLHEIQGKN